jgi:hypothetical protein
MDQEPGSGRLQNVSAHAIALAALFVALGSGAYAAVAGVNSIGSQQIKANAVGASELASDSVDTDAVLKAAIKSQQIKAQAITQQKLAAGSVGQEQIGADAIIQSMLQASSVGDQQLKDQSISQQKFQDAVVGQKQLQDNSVSAPKMGFGAVATALASENSVGTLYTNNNDTGLNITTDTQIASLSLPAGSYLVFAGVEAVHGPNPGSATRLECYITGDAGLVDFAKERLQSNANATESLIFTKQMLEGPATLASDGAIAYRCTTVGNASTLTLSQIHFQALRLAKVVAQ